MQYQTHNRHLADTQQRVSRDPAQKQQLPRMMAPSRIVGMEQPPDEGAKNHQRASRRSSKTGAIRAPLMSQKEL